MKKWVLHYRLAFDEDGYPLMYVFENCKAFRRTVPLLQFSRTNPEDLDSDGEDHVADEVRYMLMMCPVTRRTAKVGVEISDDPLDLRKG